MPGADRPQKVSIIPRGQSLGVNLNAPDEDRFHHGLDHFKNQLVMIMGGRAADKLVYNQPYAGAESDLKRATRLARMMVTHWGMSEKLGPLSLGKDHEEVFLGREISNSRNFSEKVAEDIDNEIHRLVTSGYKRAINILRENRDQLEALAESLLIKETLDRKQIDDLMAGLSVVSEEERKAFEEAQKKVSESKKSVVRGSKISEGEGAQLAEAPTMSALPQGT
jgi:cell division protease FtsH